MDVARRKRGVRQSRIAGGGSAARPAAPEPCGESWQIVWTASSPWFRWRAERGFRFASLSVSPYLPFDRCVSGSEYTGPNGPGEEESEPAQIAVRDWPTLPGGHMVYYQRAENYGALGLVALDKDLHWRGAGTRRVIAEKPAGATEIAVTFPDWAGADTPIEARKVNRMLRQPVLVEVSAANQDAVRIQRLPLVSRWRIWVTDLRRVSSARS